MPEEAHLRSFTQMLRHLREPLFLAMSDGQIVAANVAGAEALGTTVDALEGTSVAPYCPDGARIAQWLRAEVPFPLRASDGRRYFCSANLLAADLFLLRISGGPDPEPRARVFYEKLLSLNAFSSGVSQVRPAEDVVRAVLVEGMSSVGAFAGGVFLIDSTGTHLELKVSSGYPDDSVAYFRSIPLSAALPHVDAFKKSELIVIGTAEGYGTHYPHLAHAHRRMTQSAVACVPLELQGRILGVVVLGFPLPWMFSEEDLGCLKTLALECAQAVEGHLGTPWVSGGEGGVSRLELLHTFTGTLAGALSPSEVAEAVVDMGMAATSARAGGLWLLADDGASLSLVRSVGSAGPRAEDHVSVPLNRPARMPILDAVRSGSSVWIESCREMEERYPEAFRAFSQGGESSLACITLLAQGRCIGGLALAYAGARRFPPEERAFMKVLGWHSAQAVERTRLYQAQKQARDSAEANRRRSDFLADTSLILGSSLDFSETLSAVALAAVPRIADWCVIQLAEPGVLPVAAHADPAKVPFVLELSRRYRELGKGEHGIQAAIRTGKSELHSFIDAQPLTEGLGHVPEFVALVAKVGLVATMVVPILARGRTLGAIVLASSNTDRRYDERDLALAEDLGRRVGLALDNARLYRDAREADRLNPTDHLC